MRIEKYIDAGDLDVTVTNNKNADETNNPGRLLAVESAIDTTRASIGGSGF